MRLSDRRGCGWACSPHPYLDLCVMSCTSLFTLLRLSLCGMHYANIARSSCSIRLHGCPLSVRRCLRTKHDYQRPLCGNGLSGPHAANGAVGRFRSIMTNGSIAGELTPAVELRPMFVPTRPENEASDAKVSGVDLLLSTSTWAARPPWRSLLLCCPGRTQCETRAMPSV